jgi:hypothetical protein
MTESHFDPSRAVTFDLSRGLVALDQASHRVLVPSDLLVELCASAGDDARKDFGRRLGTECGRRVADRLGAGKNEASLETVLEHLGGEMALVGLGNLGVERWGKALVMTFQGSPVGAGGDALLAAVIEGALQRLFGRDCSAVRLGRDGDLVRLLVASQQTAASVEQALAKGSGWGTVLADLQQAGGS